jgi:hypothetical protein
MFEVFKNQVELIHNLEVERSSLPHDTKKGLPFGRSFFVSPFSCISFSTSMLR